MRYFLFLCLVILVFACKKDDDENVDTEPINQSTLYLECNTLLAVCAGDFADYCLFGYKWGDTSSFASSGNFAVGPKEPGGVVTYSLQESNGVVNTHRQINVPSESFSKLPSCAKEEIRQAFNAWSNVADIQFEELADNSAADIRLYVADIIQKGLGFPNFTENPCNILGGTVIFRNNINDACADFHLLALHEIGHCLGLGHVSSANIMNPSFPDFNIQELQDGDKQGLVEIYGEN